MAGEEKTERATPKKREKAREEGNVLQSKEIVTAFFLLIVFYSLKVLGSFMLGNLMKVIGDGITRIDEYEIIDKAAITRITFESIIMTAMIAAPILLISAAVSTLFSLMQTKFLFTMKATKFKMSKLNPINGFKKMLSLRSAVEIMKSLLKIAIIGYLMYDAILKQIPKLPRLMYMTPMQGVLYIADAALSIVTTIGALYIILGIIDYLYQWYQHEKDLKMSKQEVKDEFKQIEGDPQIKQRIRQKQQEISQTRMMQDVPKADVIIRNPTHYAVAIKYDIDVDNAPIIVAKGADYIALKIIQIAEEAGVEITENKPLARGLYEAAEVGWELPHEFYHAIAEVLAVVYEKRKKEL